MTDPLTTTFDILATTSRSEAHEVLVAALDLPEDPIRARAVEALLRRGGSPGHVELVRRYGSLNSKSQELIQAKAVRLNQVIEDAIDQQLVRESVATHAASLDAQARAAFIAGLNRALPQLQAGWQ